MSNDKKQSAEKIIPDSEKENLDQYSDALKEPMFGLEDRRETLEKASDSDEA